MGRGDESHRTMPRTAASERRGQDPKRHPGRIEDGQEANAPGQGGGGGEVVEGRHGVKYLVYDLYSTQPLDCTQPWDSTMLAAREY